jgi:drug/metabolite transporter (DMT)-like permease
MIRRVLWALLTVLATACASTTGFNEIPLPGRIVLLVVACALVGALQIVAVSKKSCWAMHCNCYVKV